MIINDRIYGRVNIKEPVLIELIKSRPVQRLKNISQFGIPDEFYFVKGYSRYEHSVGVMILLKKLNADLEEQIAGLLHDVSHYAFSHVIDWVLDNSENEDYQDQILADFISKSEVRPILKKYGFNHKIISNLPHFKILEREVPELCADRIDYVFREFELWSSRKNLEYCLAHLDISDDKVVFTNKKSAQVFGRFFLRCQVKHWTSIYPVAGYYFFADLLKKSMVKKIISLKDFLGIEKDIINKLRKSKDPEIIELMQIFADKQYVKQKININIKKKIRFADPKYLEHGKIVKLTKTDPKFKASINRLLNESQKGRLI